MSSAFGRTRENQWAASDPAVSAWVVANAGSGKTHVLTQRVVRLLLAGADPGSILCLTFTKTASAEMSRRIFGMLGRWATMPDDELAKAIADMQGRPPSEMMLRDARRLFARALETPGGLKIQTIHAFCEKLLHQFPFEANVPGHFEILDDTAADKLLQDARASVMIDARRPGTRVAEAVRFLAEHCSDFGIAAALDAVIARREALRRWFDAAVADGETGTVDDAIADLRRRLGLEPGETAEAVCRAICDAAEWPQATCSEITAALQEALAAAENRNNRHAHTGLTAIVGASSVVAEADARTAFFLSLEKDGRWYPRGTKSRFAAEFGRQNPSLGSRFEREAARLAPVMGRLAAVRTVEATAALLTLGDAILQVYNEEKRRAGLLDFGDLIARTRHLLSRADATAWILYKLDVRLRHILVDEAQDTSPDQWAIVQALAADFFAGEGAVRSARTIFAVGDDKQSIFGFQGAAPAMLAEMERHFDRTVRAAEQDFVRRPLFLSFRSTSEVLDAVDLVFSGDRARDVSASDYEAHAARRQEEPGRVIVKPRVVKQAIQEPDDWTAAFDAPTAAEVRLADDIALEIKKLIGGALPSGKRVTAGQILVLTRKRDAFFTAINRALRAHGIAAAGADRIAVSSHIAVLDLLALADVMLLPEDDLQLAACLKSPLFGFTEEQLLALAAERPGTLWSALQASGAEECRRAAERLRSLRAMSDQVTPFRFFATVLGPDGGRRAFRARLGGETDDVLDTCLSQALAYERSEAPSLHGFLAAVRASRSDIRRDPEEGSDGVRVMTVHGAKGLEADVVFLVDTGGQIVHGSQRDVLVEIDDPLRGPAFLWRRTKADATQLQRDADRAADAEAEREYFRLLYVAMTRARDLLYVAGIAGRNTPAKCWHSLVQRALVPADAERDPDTKELTADYFWPPEPRLPLAPQDKPAATKDAGEAPDWLFRPAPSPLPAPQPLRPSRALAEPDGPEGTVDLGGGMGSAAALRRGSLVHKLLQWLPALPEAERLAAADRFLVRHLPDDQALAASIRTEVQAVLAHPEIAPFFGADSRAELAVVGTVRTDRGDFAVSGQIDRLAIGDDGWHILDFKTNRVVPAAADAIDPSYVLQLALYRRLLLDMAPGSEVSASLAYIAGPKIIRIPPAALDAALAGIGVDKNPVP